MGKRSGIMLCYPYEEKRLLTWEPPYLIQPKLDGERARALITSSGVLLVSSEKNIIISVPHINEAIMRMGFPEGTELDGELYNHDMSMEDIHSIVSRRVVMHDEATLMHYHVFDIIPASDPQMIQGKRYMALRELHWMNPIEMVPGKVVFTKEEVLPVYQWCLDNEYEGIIVRNVYATYERKRSLFVMKFKPKKADFYTILYLEEAIDKNGNPKGMVGSFVCAGSDGTPFGVGAGMLSHQERIEHWEKREEYKGKLCEVQYQNITNKGVPRFGLCIKTLDEVADLSETDAYIKGLLMRR